MQPDEMAAELKAVQAEYLQAGAAAQRRRDLVSAAKKSGKSVYWIAQQMDVAPGTVGAILKSAAKESQS